MRGMPPSFARVEKQRTRRACPSSCCRVKRKRPGGHAFRRLASKMKGRGIHPCPFTSNLVKKRRGGVVTSLLVKLVSKNKRKKKKCGAPLAPAPFASKHVETDREVSAPLRLPVRAEMGLESTNKGGRTFLCRLLCCPPLLLSPSRQVRGV